MCPFVKGFCTPLSIVADFDLLFLCITPNLFLSTFIIAKGANLCVSHQKSCLCIFDTQLFE